MLGLFPDLYFKNILNYARRNSNSLSSNEEDGAVYYRGAWECGRWEEHDCPLDANDAATTLPDKRGVPNDNGRTLITDAVS